MAEFNTASGFFFDTVNTITCDLGTALLQDALELCSFYEQRLSRFVRDSDVWRINHAAGEPVEIGVDALKLLACAEQVRQASAGAFNVAMGSVTDLWGFSGDTTEMPSEEGLAHARRRMEGAVISIEDGRVSIPEGAAIDLGGIAKGYICDRVAEHLCSVGATSGVLNFGGNVTTIGSHPDGRPWQVGLQTPTAERNEDVFAVVKSSGGAVVTSGVYERAFIVDGRLCHHILDPRTCCPAKAGITSATVIAADGMLADALATALLVMGAGPGLALVSNFGARAVTLDMHGKLQYSEGMSLELVSNG